MKKEVEKLEQEMPYDKKTETTEPIVNQGADSKKAKEKGRNDKGGKKTSASSENELDVKVDPIPALERELESAKAESLENHDRYIRKVAEFENYRRRKEREFGELIRSSNRDLIARLLPVLENFERAMNHTEVGESFDNYQKGVEMILTQFKELLSVEGLAPIESVGKPFDPNLHEALMQIPSDDYDEGVVCEETERGYLLGDRVIRHAKVVVSIGAPTEERGVESAKGDE